MPYIHNEHQFFNSFISYLRKKCQIAYKPGSVQFSNRKTDGYSSGAPVTGCLTRPTRATCAKTRLIKFDITQPLSCRPYLILLPVGFTLP